MRCCVDVVPIRALPQDDAEQVTQALIREPLTEVERIEGWVSVTTAYGYPGWVRAWAVEDGAGELPVLLPGDPAGAARSYLGAPYEWGGMSKHGVDCSGLVHMAHRLAGVLVPRDSHEQEAAGVVISADDARRGDVITYGDESRADHVALWTGAGKILHATARDGLGVVEEHEPEALRARRRAVVRLIA